MRSLILTVLLFACVLPAAAKDKKKDKDRLPDFVLNATSVLVTVDPDAGASVAKPFEQNEARRAVEAAFRKWGRFRVIAEPFPADSSYLVVEVRKGGGARPALTGGPVNQRLPGVDVSEGGVYVDPGPLSGGAPIGAPRSTVEYSSLPDSMVVYIPVGDSQTPIWRYASKGCLDRPNVRAVEEFKKAFTESEQVKQQQQAKSQP